MYCCKFKVEFLREVVPFLISYRIYLKSMCLKLYTIIEPKMYNLKCQIVISVSVK